MCRIHSLSKYLLSDSFLLQDKFLDSCSSELARIQKFTEAADTSLDQGRAGPRADRSDAELDLSEQQQEAPGPLAQKCNGKNRTNHKSTLVDYEVIKSTDLGEGKCTFSRWLCAKHRNIRRHEHVILDPVHISGSVQPCHN